MKMQLFYKKIERNINNWTNFIHTAYAQTRSPITALVSRRYTITRIAHGSEHKHNRMQVYLM